MRPPRPEPVTRACSPEQPLGQGLPLPSQALPGVQRPQHHYHAHSLTSASSRRFRDLPCCPTKVLLRMLLYFGSLESIRRSWSTTLGLLLTRSFLLPSVCCFQPVCWGGWSISPVGLLLSPALLETFPSPPLPCGWVIGPRGFLPAGVSGRGAAWELACRRHWRIVPGQDQRASSDHHCPCAAGDLKGFSKNNILNILQAKFKQHCKT